jgi:hypothetical protein
VPAPNTGFVAVAVGEYHSLGLKGDMPTPVRLSTFEALPRPEGIVLQWTTAFESDHAGFHIHRLTAGSSDYYRLTSNLITSPGPYRFLDTEVKPGTTYFYRLETVDRSGGSEFYGPVEATAVAGAGSPRIKLFQNQPNPFVAEQGATAIGFRLGDAVHVRLRVFDASGRLVCVLVDEVLEAGPHAVLWDGKNGGGSNAGSGIYYYRLDAGELSEARTLVKVR